MIQAITSDFIVSRCVVSPFFASLSSVISQQDKAINTVDKPMYSWESVFSEIYIFFSSVGLLLFGGEHVNRFGNAEQIVSNLIRY